MSEEEKASGFVVKDKRRFSSDGEYQGEAISSPREVQASSKAEQANPRPAESVARPSGEPPSPADIQFHSLVVSLATQALVLLGEAPGPEGMDIQQDIPSAKQTIDILLMLQEKTKGNIRNEEEKLLTEILRELQMSFVRATQKQKAV